MAKGKVGLALGGGAARCLAHIGVLEVLERAGISIDIIAGTSMGAIVGALYANGRSASEIKALAMEIAPKSLSFFADPVLPKTGLIRGRKIENLLKSIIGDIEFRDLKMPFACVATDVDSGEEVVMKDGSVWKAVRASGSIPVILSVPNWEGRYLVDGGLVNPVPVRLVQEMGADFIIAVSVAPFGSIRKARAPNILEVIMQILNIASHQIVTYSLSGADIVIEPQVGNIGFLDFHRARECILQGELATQDLVSAIKKRYAKRYPNTLMA